MLIAHAITTTATVPNTRDIFSVFIQRESVTQQGSKMPEFLGRNSGSGTNPAPSSFGDVDQIQKLDDVSIPKSEILDRTGCIAAS